MMTRLYAVLLLGLIATPAAGQVNDPYRIEPATSKSRADWRDRYQEARQGPEQTERFSRTVRLGRDGSLELSNVSGDIVVTGGEGDEVKIEAVKRARNHSGDEAKRRLEELRIEVSELSSRVEVRTIYPRGRNVSVSVDYTITMPSGASATLHSVSGDVKVSNVKGELRAESVSGDVTATGATHLSLAKSVSGDVNVSDVATDGEVTVNTVSGDLTARALKARDIDFGSVSGSVTMTNVQCERATVKSVSGDLAYDGTLARNGRYELNAHSGGIRLTLAGNTGFEVEATTFSGNVRSDFPLTLRAGGDDRDDRHGPRLNRSIRGSYGDASAILDLKSFSGDIIITKR
jgi:DUF4097 and DUF4098 domain-containing protein YvlB